jgi:PAS domain S-box-containing protein
VVLARPGGEDADAVAPSDAMSPVARHGDGILGAFVSTDDPRAAAPSPASDPPAFAVKQRAALLDFWNVYETEYDRVQEAAMIVAAEHKEFGPLIRAMPSEQMAEENRKSRALLRGAIVDGEWEGYVINTRAQGSQYAKLGVSFSGWYEVVRIFQQVLVPALMEAYSGDRVRAAGATAAMMSFIDHAMTLIAEEYLRAREEDRFRRLIEAVKDYAIFLLDPRGRVETWNAGAQKFKGYEAHEIIGKHFSIFYPEQERAAGKPEAELRIAAAEGRFEDEGWRVRKDGSQFWGNVVITPIRDATGALTGFAKVTRDLTERRRAEEALRTLIERLEERTRQLENANSELDGFTYSVSHDLRAPLRAIDGFARVLLEDHAPQLDQDAKRVVDIICKNTQKMGRLIDDLLSFARLGRQEMSRTPLNMTAMVRKAAAETLDPARQFDLRVGELPQAEGDAALIQQVWLNLLGNAVKYTRPRSPATIEITADSGDCETVYAVTDNGVGFDPRYGSKLFGVFQRLHAATEFEGTGVGLALVQRIVRRHGGWVKAEGKLGEGATFSFALPRKGGPRGT